MIDESQVSAYRTDGFVLVKGLLPPAEAATLRQEAHDILARAPGEDPTWGSARALTTTATRLSHCHDVQFHSAAFSRLIVDPRFTDAAAALLGSPNLQLHHTKMFVKPPEQGSPFPMHQDHPYMPHETDRLGAAIFHLDDAPEEKGCVRVVPGSHRNGPLEHVQEGGWHLPFEQWPLDDAIPCPAKAGDVLFMSYLLVHGSGINRSAEARTTVLVQFRDAANKPTQNVHISRGQGMMLRGVAT